MAIRNNIKKFSDHIPNNDGAKIVRASGPAAPSTQRASAATWLKTCLVYGLVGSARGLFNDTYNAPPSYQVSYTPPASYGSVPYAPPAYGQSPPPPPFTLAAITPPPPQPSFTLAAITPPPPTPFAGSAVTPPPPTPAAQATGAVIGDPQDQPAVPGGYTYPLQPPAVYSLFNPSGQPNFLEVLQRQTADCYFAGMLTSEALTSRNFIEQSIVESGRTPDGFKNYQVRLFYQGAPEWYAVNDQFPLDASGKTLGYDLPSIDGKQVTWAALMQKAFVKYADHHPEVLNNPASGYARINRGVGNEALAALTGNTATQQLTQQSPLVTPSQLTQNINGRSANAGVAFYQGWQLPNLQQYGAQVQSVNLGADGNSTTFVGGDTMVNSVSEGRMTLSQANGTNIILRDEHFYTVLSVGGNGAWYIHNPLAFDENNDGPGFWVPKSLMQNGVQYIVYGDARPEPMGTPPSQIPSSPSPFILTGSTQPPPSGSGNNAPDAAGAPTPSKSFAWLPVGAAIGGTVLAAGVGAGTVAAIRRRRKAPTCPA